MLDRGFESEGGVDRGDRWKGDAPERRAAIELKHRLEGECHRNPGRKPKPARQAAGENREKRRREIDESHAGEGAEEPPRRITQLRISGTHDHATNVAEVRTRPEAHDALGQSEPDRTLPL